MNPEKQDLDVASDGRRGELLGKNSMSLHRIIKDAIKDLQELDFELTQPHRFQSKDRQCETRLGDS